MLWVAALLSSLLALDGLFRGDADDGTLEQILLSPVPMTITVLAKLAAHALVTLVPLICLVPLTAYSFNIPLAALPTLALALLLAAPTLSVLVALGAALTVSLRRGGSIVGLLVLPLTGAVVDLRDARDRSQPQWRADRGAAAAVGGARGARRVARAAGDRSGRESRARIGKDDEAAALVPPARFSAIRLSFGRAPLPMVGRPRRHVARRRRVLGARDRSAGLSAGRVVPHHLYPPANRVHRNDGLCRHGGCRRQSATCGV